MAVQTVKPSDTPNAGRLIWNQNDQELQSLVDAFGLNVKSAEFGAQGDGAADDAPAIQAAMDQCAASGGGNVFLPAGSYLLKSASLLLRDGVNLIGAGPTVSKLLIGDRLNKPAITDEPDTTTAPYAFGVVRVAHLSVDGRRGKNPSTPAAIATTAFYSIFEDVAITNCAGHGFLIGNASMSNFASQNQFIGCRVTDCAQAAFYFDINAVDSVVAHCFLSQCDYGVVVNNGGIRIVNNVIFGHAQSGVLLTQTVVTGVIALNDLNYNLKGNIVITRTSAPTNAKWSSVLVANNVILGDALDTDNAYDAINISSDVPDGIYKVSIIGNKIYTPEGANRFRYGVSFAKDVIESTCLANDVADYASGAYYVDSSCRDIRIDQTFDVQNNTQIDTPAVPNSGTALSNDTGVPVTVYLRGGAVSDVLIGSFDTGLNTGTFRLRAGAAITILYTEAPAWQWIAD